MSLSIPQRNEAIVVASFALLSALALAFVVLRTIRLVTELFLKRDSITSRAPDILFFRTRLGHYAACLILSNIFLTVARLIDLSWVSRSGLSGGPMCTAQAVLMQIGIWSVSWFTASHGVHALCTLVFHIPQARWLTAANITVGWASAFIVGLAPLQQRDVYGPVEASCTVTLSHPMERFALQVFPIILGAIVSITVYAIVFVVLRGKLSVNSIQKLRRSNSARQRDDKLEEYHQFIIMIVQTMFWFPLAFVLLLLPFCITHLLLVAGYSVPSAACVFADVCVSILGFVNVSLLCNTFRVIKHVYHGSRGVKVVVETVKTFGNDASGELPIIPPKTYNYKPSSSNHSSWSSVDSNSELVVENASFEQIQAKVPYLPPAELNRQLGGNSSVILPLHIIKKRDIKFRSEITVDSPSPTDTLDPYPPQSPFVTENARHELPTRNEVCSFQPTADIVVSGTSAKEPTFKSKAPPALNLSRFSVDTEPPPLSRQVSNKSAALAARLGIPVASAPFPSSIPAVYSSHKLDKGKARAPITPIPQRADESKSRPSSSSSSTSTVTLGADSDSDYSVKIMHARKVRPLPQIPDPSDDEDDTTASHAPAPQDLDARSRRTTIATVWSQESGDTLNQPLYVEGQEAGRQPVADMLVPRVMLGDQADVGGMPGMSKQGTRVPPKPLLLPSRVALKLSTGLSGMLSPKSPHVRFSLVTSARNDNVV